jgi:hypothetical protein
MHRTFLPFVTRPLFVSLLLSSPLHAAAIQHLTLEVDGRQVDVELTPRESRENPAFSHGEHFRGHIADEPGSWVRLSHIDGQWQGLINARSGLHVLEPAKKGVKRARALADLNVHFQCGNAPSFTPRASAVGLNAAVRDTIDDFENLCDDAIDGICAGIEVEMVFDKEFVAAFPDDYEAQGASLLNMVEGFYLDGFGIRLNALAMTYLDTDVFVTETTSENFLNDIRLKKQANELDFVTNSTAILHVIKGTPFTDPTTAGIAWLGGMCSNAGFSSGASLLYRQSVQSTPSLAITSLITTHEIGHNLGASHDDAPDVGCTSGYLMNSTVDPNANSFSSCSQSAIKGFLGNLTTWADCTNYPVKMNVTPDPENDLELEVPSSVSHQFTVNYEQGYQTPAGPVITLTMEGAEANAAQIEGRDCVIASDRKRITCAVSNVSSSLLTLTLDPTWARATVNLQPEFGVTSNVFNVADDDGRYSYVLDTAGPAAPGELIARIDGRKVRLDWEDNTTDETGFEVQRRTSGGDWEVIATPGVNVEQYSDTVPAEGTYQYRVLALRADINSGPSNIASISYAAFNLDDKHGSGGGTGTGTLLLIAALRLLRLPSRHKRHD